MKCIEIIATPPGEAPEEIRRRWIGVVIPLPANAQTERERTGYGVLTGPPSWLRTLFPFLQKKSVRYKGYSVSTVQAIEALSKIDELAAEWWRKNTPHLIKGRRMFLFHGAACRIVER